MAFYWSSSCTREAAPVNSAGISPDNLKRGEVVILAYGVLFLNSFLSFPF